MSIAKANLDLLTERVNAKIRRTPPHSRNYICEVRNGTRGSAALQEIVRQVETELLREAAAASEAKAA